VKEIPFRLEYRADQSLKDHLFSRPRRFIKLFHHDDHRSTTRSRRVQVAQHGGDRLWCNASVHAAASESYILEDPEGIGEISADRQSDSSGGGSHCETHPDWTREGRRQGSYFAGSTCQIFSCCMYIASSSIRQGDSLSRYSFHFSSAIPLPLEIYRLAQPPSKPYKAELRLLPMPLATSMRAACRRHDKL
jgi:hypothetical protein